MEIIVDDTPEAIILSCFDSVRREIARLSLHKLVTDGRIHPARIEEIAGAGDVVVSRTVTDLMIGDGGVEFEPLGGHELRGLPGDWPLFRAVI